MTDIAFSCSLRAARCIGSVSLAALMLVSTSDGLQTAVANGDTRTLTIHHTHSNEDITVTFKRNGKYDDAALEKLNWFLRDWRTNEPTKMDSRLFDVVWEVYHDVDGRQPIQIISAYRSPHTNAMLRRRSSGVAQYSQHMVGRAMDFFIPGVSLEQIRHAGLRLQRGGVGFYPTSGSPFVHLDVGSVRHWPRMNHDELARVFPDGKTVHVPSDGQPLRNYALALAEVERRGGNASATSSDSARTAGVIRDDSGRSTSPDKSKHNLLAKLFGFRGESEDEDERPTAPAPRALPDTEKPTQVATQVAAAVPLPAARPSRPPPPSTQPVQVPQRNQTTQVAVASAAQSPSDIINARGAWRGEGIQSSAPVPPADIPNPEPPATIPAQQAASGAIGSSGQRFVWLTGPQPVRSSSSEGVETTSSIATSNTTPWPMPSRADRVPTDVALAYATNATPDPVQRMAPATRSVAPAAPHGAPASSATISSPAAAPTALSKTDRPMPKPGQRFDDPWLHGLIVSPSVHYAMSVTALGNPDYRNLAPLMHKPASAVVMTFVLDPNYGMTSASFSGSAVSFVPTMNFVTRTAALR
jgi:uncharacterized protein YcbK (DUF882 family)